jgi:hypothetical protein
VELPSVTTDSKLSLKRVTRTSTLAYVTFFYSAENSFAEQALGLCVEDLFMAPPILIENHLPERHLANTKFLQNFDLL